MQSRQDTVELFRSRLLDVIERADLSRSAFARRVGIDRSTLAQILSPQTDRLPRMETLIAIANSEQVSVDWLVGLSQDGRLGTDIVRQSIEFERGGQTPSDAVILKWHAEAAGYKIRHVPATLPDIVKTKTVIEYEYQDSSAMSPHEKQESSDARLRYQRRPETDMEVCTSRQALEGLARGEGIWSGLSKRARKEQVAHIAELCQELYPTFRWFLFDALQKFSVPLTIFGPKRAAIYLGEKYFVLNSSEHIRVLTAHFDDLICAATVQPTGVSALLDKLHHDIG
ncbi:MAG: helix-turn-helix transcriptional regulator [Myxococcales bacterium]|nr:MAG: helix-turn-helix transcriptional regulator [Myxococcales bacterium]